MSDFMVEVQFVASDTAPDTFEDFLDKVIDEFARIEIAVDVTAALAKHTATFVWPIENAGVESVIKALGDLRTALHAGGCGTPGWPDHYELRQMNPMGQGHLVDAG